MLNKVTLIGHLGRDPEVRTTQNGTAVCNLSVATTEKWRDKNSGEQTERTEWHRVVLFGNLADISGRYLAKGSLVYIEGQLQTRKWQNQKGEDQYTTEIVCQGFSGVMKMLGGVSNAGSTTDTPGATYGGGSDDLDDDIPFR